MHATIINSVLTPVPILLTAGLDLNHKVHPNDQLDCSEDIE
jgi:hypothetical protein